jgi:hypothetical protein
MIITDMLNTGIALIFNDTRQTYNNINPKISDNNLYDLCMLINDLQDENVQKITKTVKTLLIDDSK